MDNRAGIGNQADSNPRAGIGDRTGMDNRA